MEELVLAASRLGERGLARMSQVIEHLQLRLRAVECTRDPQVKNWIAVSRAAVANGEVDRRVKLQPDDPRELLGRS
jgi:hypothetical protein